LRSRRPPYSPGVCGQDRACYYPFQGITYSPPHHMGSSFKESRMRHAVPPSSALPRVAANRSRPQSMLSQNSQASSGLENIVWRNSSFSTSTIDSHRRLTISGDDTAQRVVLGEEHLQERMETALKLCDWYRARLTSLDKRKRLLEQGLVALETAVHEQKLNFLRAHVTELSRRIVSLMETNERGFPSHANFSLPQPYDDQLVWLHRQNLMLNQVLLYLSLNCDAIHLLSVR
ncbi:unnamed protein product, partial [Angiostrongylus costaricensis]|uniref:EB1 C-terminal domain-containing protein n=1 Tax=Angiostrongylus costaricensis TaxID=334426 RepID=A0A0R3PFP5_ANGCS